ncbi:MAG: thioredoxin domain-containing protein [Myxococcota bacterium]
MVVLGSGLVACANGTETSTKKTSKPAPAAAAAASADGPRLPSDTVVATWKGGQLTYGELLEAGGPQMRKMRNKFLLDTYNLERQLIEQKVIETLVKAAAKAKGVEEDAFVEGEVGEITVTDEEVKQFHASEPRISSQPLEGLAPRIKAFLQQKKQQEKMLAVFTKIKEDAQMKVELPRVQLEKIPFELEGRPSKGKADAKVTVVEFSDFECPYCSRAVSGVEALLKAYPDDIRVVFMHMPLSMHRNAMPAAVAGQCANQQGKFWPFHDALFENQRDLTAATFEAHAKKVGLDLDKFKACVKDPKTTEFVQKDMEQASKAGVEGTPTFFINGEPFSRGVPSVEDLKSYIEG